MATAQPMYHAPTFEPTVDEIATLKRLEMGEAIAVPGCAQASSVGAAAGLGLHRQVTDGVFISPTRGAKLIRRQDN